ncbi:hypothetical protein BS78_10G213200 [Paspalum vaginatum]|nr:hypothetical protein BS78_10G213200 [Paspalum vaginatum]
MVGAAARAWEVKAEGFLRGGCAALAAAAALLVGLSTQTENVLLIRKRATVKDVQALWVLAMAAAAAAGYHLLQLLKCAYLGRAGVNPCRRSSAALAWTCLLLDKGTAVPTLTSWQRTPVSSIDGDRVFAPAYRHMHPPEKIDLSGKMAGD